MTTVKVDILDERAIALLQDLEGLNIIRLHQNELNGPPANYVSIKDLKGKMTKQPIEEIEQQLKNLRAEWD